jgi:hypothetical protein
MLLATPYLHADINCLDNSHHLLQKYDNKEYYLVKNCTCPCEKKYKIYPGRGECSQCHHYRDPRPFIIISNNFQTKKRLILRQAPSRRPRAMAGRQDESINTKGKRK